MDKNMEEKTVTEYNLKDLYDNEVASKVAEIKKICKLNRLPFVFSCAIINENGETIYKNEGVFPGSNGLVLFKNLFTKIFLLMRGAELKHLSSLKEPENDVMDYMFEMDNTVEKDENYVGDL